jgi:hypothetical protein
MPHDTPAPEVTNSHAALKVELNAGPAGSRAVALQAFKPGDVLGSMQGCRTVKERTYLTVQTGPDTHIVDIGDFVFMNHSCHPNVAMCVDRLEVVALRPIAPGDELTFFYPSTEWEMDRPFICRCGAKECVGVVAGAKFLSIETLGQHFVTGHIRGQVMEALDAQQRRLTAGVVGAELGA